MKSHVFAAIITLNILFLFNCCENREEVIIEAWDNGTPKSVNYIRGSGINQDLVGRITYFQNGIIESKVEFLDGFKNGLYSEYYSDGQKKVEGYYLNGKRDGGWIEWFENGVVKSQADYLFDSGTVNSWGMDGIPSSQYIVEGIDEYGNPVRNGKYKDFHDGGNVLSEGTYESNLQIGEWKYYYPSGELYCMGYYDGGRGIDSCTVTHIPLDNRHGIWTFYDERGLKYLTQDSKEIGARIDIYFNDNGTIDEYYTYVDGSLNGHHYKGSRTGQTSIEGEYKNDQLCGIWKYWDENGKMIKQIHYGDSASSGITYWYYDSGIIKKKSEFLDTLKHGLYEEYYKNGQIRLSTNYKNGILNGNSVEYFESGRKKLKGQYFNGNKYGQWTTNTGLEFEDLVLGKGEFPETGDIVQVHYTGWLADGTIFDNSLDRGQPFEFPIGTGRVIPGWDEGVATMQVGTKRRLTIPSDLAYGERGAGNVIPPNAILIFEVELLDIKKPFKDTDFDLPGKEVTTESGLRMIIHIDGDGSMPISGQTVVAHYTGLLEDGTKFDSSHDRGQPFEFPVGQGRVIPGWDEAFLLMSKGEKRTLIIPPDLGYGEAGAGPIPPNSILIFEVELIDYK